MQAVVIYALRGLLVKWSRRRPLTAKAGVRLPYGSPKNTSELCSGVFLSNPKDWYVATTKSCM